MKKAVCNELFGSLGFRESCELLSEHGFEGVEIAPFTLFNENGKFTSEKVRTIRNILDETGISFAGFHWLFAKPEGLLMVSKDPKQRNTAWDHLRHLLEISGELGGGPLTFGSPVQRYAREVPPEQAVGFLRKGLQDLCGSAGSCNSEVLIEALSSGDTNVINTLAQAEAFVESVDCPSIQGMFDFHNCTDETLPWNQLVSKYMKIIRHVHLNTRDGGHPVEPDEEYTATFRTLYEQGYTGWVSLEIFHVPSDPVPVLEETSRFLDRMRSILQGEGISF